MPNEKNKQLVENLKVSVSNAKSIVFADYHGLSAQALNNLRAKLGEMNAEASISKNTLLKIALREKELDTNEMDAFMKGPTITVFSYEDPIAGVKIMFDFAKDHENLPEIKAGVVDGKFVNYAILETLSNLPSKNELLAKAVGGMKSPLFGLVNTLGGVQKNFVYVLSAIAEKKEE